MITYGFYNSINHDRKYNALQFGSIFDGIVRDGIFMSIGGHFNVVASEGMMVIVDTGRAWFDHTWTLNDAALPLYIPQSEIILDRIDAIVIDVNAEVGQRKNDIIVVKGTPSKEPQRPAMIKTTNHHQYPLAYISVKAGVTSIRTADISITVGTSEAPYVTGILETVNIDNLLAKWEDEWQIFFDAQTEEMDETDAFWKQQWQQWYDDHTTEWTQDFTEWFGEVRDILTDDPAGVLTEHVTNKDNPHEVTASQVHAVSTLPNQGLSNAEKKNAVANIDSVSTLPNQYLSDEKRKNAMANIRGLAIAYVTYTVGNESQKLALLDNPLSLFGNYEGHFPYCIIFADSVGTSPLGGGTSCIYGYTYSGGDYGAQIAIKYGITGSIMIRTEIKNVWTDWSYTYSTANKPTASAVGALPSTTPYALGESIGGAAVNSKALSGFTWDKFGQRFHWQTAGEAATGYFIKIRIESKATWMVSFDLTVYQNYRQRKFMISGYNYSSNNDHWYAPCATLATSNGTTDHPRIGSSVVYFGYDSDDVLFIAIDAGNYTGLTIDNINPGYIQVINDWSGIFKLSLVSSIGGTIQSTQTVYRPYHINEKVNDADTVDGFHANTSQIINTLVTRNASGYIYTNYINSNTLASENPTIGQFIVTTANDNFYRKASLAHVKTSLGIDSVNTEITNLKNSVSNGKAQVASAITAKGVTTAADATFATMADNIGKISTGTKNLGFARGGANIYGYAKDGEFTVSFSITDSQWGSAKFASVHISVWLVGSRYEDTITLSGDVTETFTYSQRALVASNMSAGHATYLLTKKNSYSIKFSTDHGNKAGLSWDYNGGAMATIEYGVI